MLMLVDFKLNRVAVWAGRTMQLGGLSTIGVKYFIMGRSYCSLIVAGVGESKGVVS